MTTQAVTTWLAGLGLGEYAEAFRANNIDSAMLRDLTDAELQTLGVASLGHRKRLLAGIAALVSPPPAPAPLPAPLPDPPPEHPCASLIPRLPTPLALPLAEYFKETEPKLKLWDACDAVEDLLRLLVFLGVGELCRLRGDLPDDLRRDFHQAIEQPTLGNWWRMSQQVAQHVAGQVTGPESADTALPELPSAIAETLAPVLDGPAGPRTAERSFLALRNQLAHGGVTRRQAARLLQHWQAPFEALWPALAWLADLHLTVRTATGYGSLRGPDTKPEPLAPPPAAPIDPAFAAQDAVIALRGEQVIPLWPLALFGIPRHPEHGSDPADPPLPQVYVRRGQVNLQYRPLGATGIVQSESDQSATERFLALFRAPERERSKDRQGFSVQGFEDSFRDLAARLIGRTRERETLRRALAETPSGVLWLDGRAGVGKSYLVADLAAERINHPPADTLVLGYQFRADDGLRCARDPFLRFACERIQAALPPADRPAPEGDGQPPKPLERLKTLLARLADQTTGARRVLFLLDGLDEIAERDRRFVHDLPLGLQGPNLSWLCAGRPEQGLPEAFAAAGAVRVFPDGLPPMGADDVRAMLMERIGPLRKRLLRQDTEAGERVGNPFIDKVVRLSEGLPLYVKYVIDDIFAGRYRVLDAGETLPPGLHAYHEALLLRLGIGDLQQILTPLAATLTVAREPLSAPALADLLHRRGELVPAGEPGVALVRRALGAIQTMLRAARTSEGEPGYVLYHHSLAQHMAGEQSETRHAVASAQRFLANQAEPVRSGPLAPYLFRRGIGHLLEVGRPDAALGLLTCFDYLMDRLRTLPDPGGVEGLGADWRATLRLSPIPDQATRLWEAFFREREHILRRGDWRWPAYKILLQLAAEHADDSPVTLAAEQWLAGVECDWVWLRNPQRATHAVPNLCIRVLEGHTGPVNGAHVFPDGRILTWSEDGTLRLWDSRTAKTIFKIPQAGPQSTWRMERDKRTGDIVGSGQGDGWAVTGAQLLLGDHILSWGQDNNLRLWDQLNGALLAIFVGHKNHPTGVATFPDGRILSWSNLFSTYDYNLRMWGGHSGALLANLSRKGELIYNAWIVGNERIVFLAEHNLSGYLCLLDVNSGEVLTVLSRSFIGPFGIQGGIQVFPDGRILSWSNDRTGTLHLWDGHSGKPLGILMGHTGEVCGARLLSDARVLSWSADHTLRLWDGQTGNPIASLLGHKGAVQDTKVLANGHILSWSRDRTLRLWDGQTGMPLAEFVGHLDEISGVEVLDDRRFVSWSQQGSLILFDLQTDAVERISRTLQIGEIKGARALPDESILAWSCDTRLQLFDISTEEPLVNAMAHKGRVWGVSILSDGRIISWSEDHTLRIWDGFTGVSLVTLAGHTGWVTGAQELPGGRILSWSTDGTLRLWAGQTGEPLATLAGHAEWVERAMILTDDRILSWSKDRTLRLWDGHTGANLAILSGHTDWINGAEVLEDGRILSWSKDRTLRLWHGQTGAPLATLSGHSCSIDGARILPNGNILSWASNLFLYPKDNDIRLWDGKTAEPLAGLSGHASYIMGVHLFPDGRFLSWSLDDGLRLWDGHRGTLLASEVDSGIFGAEELSDGRIVSWHKGGICQIWAARGGQQPCFDTFDLREAPWSLAESFYRTFKYSVSGKAIAMSSGTKVEIFHHLRRVGEAGWQGASDVEVQTLSSEGILVVTLASGHVFCLQLYRGNQRITIADYEGADTAPGEPE